jgi:hypothetical protein
MNPTISRVAVEFPREKLEELQHREKLKEV